MKSMLGVITVLLLALGGGCRRADYRVAAIYVPQMQGEACVAPIVMALLQCGADAQLAELLRPGVVSNRVGRISLESRTLEIQYDSLKMAVKNLEHAIAAAGFEANGIPADASARAALPEACR